MHLEAEPDSLIILASTRQPQVEGSWQELKFVLPRKKAYFTGTGRAADTLLPLEHDQLFSFLSSLLS